MTTTSTRLRRPLLLFTALAAGDLAVFVVFTVAGLASHGLAVTPAAAAQTVLPLGVAWLLLGGGFGLYRASIAARPLLAVQLIGLAWPIAGAMGLLARAVWEGRAPDPAFAVIAMLLNLALLMAWRVAAAYILRSRTKGERA